MDAIPQHFRLELIDYKHKAHYWKDRYQKSLKVRSELESKVKELEGKVCKLNKKLYGKKSEKSNPKKSKLSTPKKRGQQPENKQPDRKTFDHLPAETEVYQFEDGASCSCCGKPFDDFGFSDETETLEIEVKPYVRKIIRKKAKKTCQCDGGSQLMTAPSPQKLIPRCLIGISIWMEILISKFHFGQPLNRTLNSFALRGMVLPPGTITGGLKKIPELFQPVVDAIQTRCLQASFWHADETRWSVFEKIPGKESTRWYLWLFESQDAAMFILDPTRSTEVIENFFGNDVSGTLMVDRYSAYQCYIKSNPNVHLAFCWAHIRREFLDYTKESPEKEDWAMDWVDRIRRLYKDRSTVVSMKGTITRQLNSGELCHGQKRLLMILKNNWSELTRFVQHPEVPMDNNEAERTLRTPVVGRKNFYGSGSTWSAKLSAQCYSIFKTLTMNDINIHQWLETYFNACAANGGKPPQDISRFLPWESMAGGNSPPGPKDKVA
jgi:transposase